jgi:hypothetical protein
MGDQLKILQEERFDFIEGWGTPCSQGLRRLGETRVPFAEWFYPVHLSIEYDGTPPPTESVLYQLNFYRQVYVEDTLLPEFLRRMEPVFQIWRETGSWTLLHPWMEAMLPWDRAAEYIDGVLKSLPPHILSGGQVLLWCCSRTVANAPLFMQPEGKLVMGLGIQPAVSRYLVAMVRSLMNRAGDLAMQIGGKRYLSGWVEFDHARWKEHFGHMWPRILQWKKFFDSNGLLNPDFIRYSE